MKKKIFILILSLLINLNLYAQSQVYREKMYFGLKIGWSLAFESENFSDEYRIIENFVDINKIPKGIFVGFLPNEYFAFEIGYTFLGKKDVYDQVAHGHYISYGSDFIIKLNFPVFERIKVYGKLGAMLALSDFKMHRLMSNQRDETITLGLSPLASGGIELQLSDNLSARGDYQIINRFYQKPVGDLSNEPYSSTVNFSLIYVIYPNKNINMNFLNRELQINKIYFDNYVRNNRKPLNYIININYNKDSPNIDDKTKNLIREFITALKYKDLEINYIEIDNYINKKLHNYKKDIYLNNVRSNNITNALIMYGVNPFAIYIKDIDITKKIKRYCARFKDIDKNFYYINCVSTYKNNNIRILVQTNERNILDLLKI